MGEGWWTGTTLQICFSYSTSDSTEWCPWICIPLHFFCI